MWKQEPPSLHPPFPSASQTRTKTPFPHTRRPLLRPGHCLPSGKGFGCRVPEEDGVCLEPHCKGRFQVWTCPQCLLTGLAELCFPRSPPLSVTRAPRCLTWGFCVSFEHWYFVGVIPKLVIKGFLLFHPESYTEKPKILMWAPSPISHGSFLKCLFGNTEVSLMPTPCPSEEVRSVLTRLQNLSFPVSCA